MQSNSPIEHLGGISIDQFLAEYWQKKPLLIRSAFPGFPGLLSPNELAGLACEEDAQARLISYVKGKWKMEQGPFAEDRFSELPESNWTLLVQGLNHHLSEAVELLANFNFIPHARLDDLMVSYAPNGGGVGPHFDSYDVFLLQGMGKRLWRVSEQDDLSLVPDSPLRILKNFVTEQEWVLEAGDMLYLPPHVAHWGIAVGDCMTYSIGFRAPSAQELGREFLGFMQDQLQLKGMYADPDLRYQSHPAVVSTDMVDQVHTMLENIKWEKQDIAKFLGEYLTEPKAHIVFETAKKISLANFEKKLIKQGISLALKSQMLYAAEDFYLNGEMVSHEAADTDVLLNLADHRKLLPELISSRVSRHFIEQLYAWYLSGYLEFL